MFMKARAIALLSAILFLSSFVVTAQANTYGSVEPIANPVVLNTEPLHDQALDVRVAFAERALQCGVVNQVIDALSSRGAVKTINGLNTSFEIGAGGFAGDTNPAFVYTVMNDGPNAASTADIAILTDSLGYVFSQFSAFLLDTNKDANFGFQANYVVVNFPTPPTIEQSAAFFRRVGSVDRELFATDTSGYTQYGRAYVSLQSDVSEEQFSRGYFRAAQQAGLAYTPIVNGLPSLFIGRADFPGNDWSVSKRGQEYLARIPASAHQSLGRIRDAHLNFTQDALRKLRGDDDDDDDGGDSGGKATRQMAKLKCR